MNMASPSSSFATVPLADLAATEALARRLAAAARAGDVIALHGPLGAGKTAFARAFIAARAAMTGEEIGEVPSPTFTLAQLYDMADPPLWHFDLYRLDKSDDALELGIEEAFADGIALIEWPERLGPYLPRRALHLHLEFAEPEGARMAQLTGGGDWPARLESVL